MQVEQTLAVENIDSTARQLKDALESARSLSLAQKFP
jgi:hypothetical protein